ncbi:MAG TPA: hypothetical protein VFY05_08055, partial [Candidatus Angelobacter sp.]|nr:hypothetical protein [Candidatus Angelobacter sp.]
GLLIGIAIVFLVVGVFGTKLLPAVPGRSRPELAMRPTARVALFVLCGVFLVLGVSRLMT